MLGNSKKEDLEIVVKALRELFQTICPDVEVQVNYTDDPEREKIIVIIDGGKYVVPVACENRKQMVKSVVDRLILKL